MKWNGVCRRYAGDRCCLVSAGDRRPECRQSYNSCPSGDIGQVSRSDRRDRGNVKVRPPRIDSTSTWIKRAAVRLFVRYSRSHVSQPQCRSRSGLVSISLSPFNTRIHNPCPDRCLMPKCIHLIIGATHYTPYCRVNSASWHLSAVLCIYFSVPKTSCRRTSCKHKRTCWHARQIRQQIRSCGCCYLSMKVMTHATQSISVRWIL